MVSHFSNLFQALILSCFIKGNQSLKINRFLTPKLQPTLKLPVWPVYGGVFVQLSDWLGGKFILTDKLLDSVGGRVVPMTLADSNLSPFLLLVHHCHSFLPFDPVRAITRFILPEGFPAHPHSGFSTVTYCIDGGLRHRDSEGNKMEYGNGDVQWMTAGRGTIHEEMWDLKETLGLQKIEIFQLWVNLPVKDKNVVPEVTRLRNEDIPVLRSATGVSCKIIAGSVEEQRNIVSDTVTNININSGSRSSNSNKCELIFRFESPVIDNTHTQSLLSGPGGSLSSSPIGILHVNIPANGVLRLSVPSLSTAAAYLRRGSLVPGSEGEIISAVSSCNLIVFDDKEIGQSFGTDRVSNQEKRNNKGEQLMDIVQLKAGELGLDALILLGEPLREPVLMRGPLVQSTEEAISRSAQVFNAIDAGGYWEATLPDDDWLKHVQKLSLQRLISQFNK